MDRSRAKERTRRAYDRVGRDYDNWYWMEKARELRAGLTERAMEKIRQEVEPRGRKRPRVLDLCCGTGHLAEALDGYDYTGLDFAPHMVSYCREVYPGKRFILADAEDLPFEDSSFNAVVCFWSFHHILYPQRVVEEMRRVLKPDGLALIATFKSVRLNLLAYLADQLSDHYWGYITKRYSKGEMKRLMSGFKNVEIEIFPKGFSILNAMGIRFLIANGRNQKPPSGVRRGDGDIPG